MPAPKGNKYALGNSGRPKMFSSPEEMQVLIDAYFEKCDNHTVEIYNKKLNEIVHVKHPLPYTVEGLALALGFTSLQAMWNYGTQEGYEEFFDTIKRAKLVIQNNKIQRGLTGLSNPAVTIFDLKNNHGYKEKTEHELTGANGGPISITEVIKKANEES